MKNLLMFGLLLFVSVAGGAAIYDGTEQDYQPAVLERPSGELWVVFERLDGGLSGDLYLTRSLDAGSTWITPTLVLQSNANERHPALVQTSPTTTTLFYLTSLQSGYGIVRATTSDGIDWLFHDVLDLGWPTPSEINPSVWQQTDGTLVMTYQRISGGGVYLTRSFDAGVTWEPSTLVQAGAALPRVAYREQDQTYLVVYQVNPGNNDLNMYVELSRDPSNWSAAPIDFSTAANSHDAQPIVLNDGTWLVTYILQQGNDAFDLFARYSRDGQTWEAPIRLTDTIQQSDVQPHPLINKPAVGVFWGHQESSSDYDIWYNAQALANRYSSFMPALTK